MKLIRRKTTAGSRSSMSVCSLCDEPLLTKGDIRGHLLAVHFDVYEQIKLVADNEPQGNAAGADDGKCRECGETSGVSEQLFLAHVKSSHSDTPYYCTISICHLLFSSYQSLRDHHRKKHTRTKFQMPLVSQIKNETGGFQANECQCCRATFKNLAQLTKHVRSKHLESYWPCPHSECFYFGINEQQFEAHVSTCCKKPQRQRTSNMFYVKAHFYYFILLLLNNRST